MCSNQSWMELLVKTGLGDCCSSPVCYHPGDREEDQVGEKVRDEDKGQEKPCVPAELFHLQNITNVDSPRVESK
jgi:hypothetical protein